MKKTAREIISEKLEILSQKKTGLNNSDYMLLLINTCIEGAEEYANQTKHEFSKGYICASAQIVLQHGETTIAQDVLQCNFMTIDEMRKIGVEESDIEALTPVIKEIIRKNKS